MGKRKDGNLWHYLSDYSFFCLIWVIISFAFSIPIGWAFLILLGATAVVGAIIYFLRKLQKPQLKKC